MASEAGSIPVGGTYKRGGLPREQHGGGWHVSMTGYARVSARQRRPPAVRLTRKGARI